MTSKQRAYLKGLASTMEPIVHVGKGGASPEVVKSAMEALEARELIKISVLKNCMDDPRSVAEIIAERTHSEVVHVIGKKIVLYKANKDKPSIKLPLD
jgi:RNA-binding protein